MQFNASCHSSGVPAFYVLKHGPLPRRCIYANNLSLYSLIFRDRTQWYMIFSKLEGSRSCFCRATRDLSHDGYLGWLIICSILPKHHGPPYTYRNPTSRLLMSLCPWIFFRKHCNSLVCSQMCLLQYLFRCSFVLQESTATLVILRRGHKRNTEVGRQDFQRYIPAVNTLFILGNIKVEDEAHVCASVTKRVIARSYVCEKSSILNAWTPMLCVSQGLGVLRHQQSTIGWMMVIYSDYSKRARSIHIT